MNENAMTSANTAYSTQEKLLLLSEQLRKTGQKLKVAESFTGGGLASRIVSVAGASNYFFEGLVCYSPLSKTQRLGVSAEIIEKYGVVSAEVAEAMVAGLLKSGNCDIAVATTGNAGPDSDASGLGVCYLAIGTPSFTHTVRKQYTGDRGMITEQAIQDCIGMLYNNIIMRN